MKKIELFVAIVSLNMLFISVLRAGDPTVMGRITHEDGRPASRVIVSVGDKFTYTDVRGRYRIRGLPTGEQELVIKRWDGTIKELPINIDRPLMKIDANIP